MVNVRNIVVDAYKMVGDIGDQEALDGTRTVIGVQLLNDLVASLNLEGYFAFTQMNLEHIVTESKMEYTIGIPNVAHPDVDIDAQRPSTIARMYVRDSSSSTPLEVTGVAPADIYRYHRSTGASTPTYYAYRSEYPLGVLSLDVMPTGGSILTVVYNKHIPVTDINDELEMPPEYESSLKFALAYIVAVRYGKPAEVISDMKMLRDESVKVIKANTISRTPLTHILGTRDGGQTIYNMGI